MSKPMIHAKSSAKKYGGIPEDYIEIHQWFDQTKAHFGDNRHRTLLHNSFGIFLCESVFGIQLINSDNKTFSVRDVGEQHIIEDLGFIPNVGDYLCEMPIKDWMCGGKEDCPQSRKAIKTVSADEINKLIELRRKSELITGMQRTLIKQDEIIPVYKPNKETYD
jgi:hypothetical protein